MPKIISNKSNVDLDYPVVRPSLDLDFTQEELDPRITFSRGTSGTRVNRNRLIETVAANQPRFDYDPVTGECKGLLIEETRTNIALQSENINTSPWSTSTLTFATNSIVAPDGNTTADKLIENPSFSSFKVVSQSVGTISGTYTVSGFFKAGERFRGYLQLFGAGGNATVIFNLRTGTISGGAGTNTITSYGNGWYRVTSTAVFTSATAAIYVVVQNDSGTSGYTGDGTSGLYCWGVQVEASGTPTSYIPTDGTAGGKPRSTDLVRMTGTNFSSWYNPTEGTLYAAVRTNALGGSGYPGIAYVDDGTLNNCIGLVVMDAVTDRVGAEAYASGANQFFYNSNSAIVPNQLSKVIASYSLNNYSAAFSDRDNIQRDINGIIPTVNRLLLGDLRGGNGRLNGVLARFTYYPRKLKDNQLLYLTQ